MSRTKSQPPFGQTPELLTPRLLMRGHRAGDFDAMLHLWSDERVIRHILGRPSTPSETWTRLLRYVGHWQVLGFGYWAIEDRTTGAFLGEVGFADYKRDIQPSLDGVPEAGWVIAPEAQGKGLATEALAAALAWADANFIDPKTTCIMAPQHAASIRVAAKNGFAERGLATFMNEPTLVMERIRPNG